MIKLDKIIDELVVKEGLVFWTPQSLANENA
jgi:hypothetical protein